MKQCDLETIYSELASQLPTKTDGNECIALWSENLPLLPSQITTNNLYVKKGEHFYNDWFKVDNLHFFAHKETYRYLGLLILSVVFHQRIAEVEIRLNHQQSEIKSLIVENAPLDINQLPSGYHSQPFAFQYYPNLPARHPFDRCILPADLPCFELSNSTNLNFTDEDWKQRDTIRVFGSDAGMVLFAELLLNLSLQHNEQDEFELEGESGFRGVGISSAEVRLFLPNSLFWTEEHWQ
jgi:hypothetical protein